MRRVFLNTPATGFKQGSQSFPDCTAEIVDALVEGERAALRCRLTATNLGTFMRQPATARRVQF
jgi:predicted ester cyclase